MTDALPTVLQSQEILGFVKKALHDPLITVEKLNGLLDFQERLMNKNAEIEANEAFARVLKNMPRIKKNGLIDYNKPNVKPIPYAKWEDVQDAIRPIYEAENFTLSFDTVPNVGGGIVTTALLKHANGHVIKSSFAVPLDTSGGKQNVQGMGSSSSFAMRYATRNLFNLVFEGEDDDGVRGGRVNITEEQMKKLSVLIVETGTNEANFLRDFFELTELGNMSKQEFPIAMNMLMKKAQTKKGNA